MPRLRMSGFIPLLRLCAVMTWTCKPSFFALLNPIIIIIIIIIITITTIIIIIVSP